MGVKKVQGKGKSIAEPSYESDDQGSDYDLPRPETKKRKKTKKGEEKRPSKSAPTPALRMKKMKDMSFTQTRWADQQLLRDLGIFESVHEIFQNMGLLGLFNMEYMAYESASKQFIATLSFYDDTSLDVSDENRGRISFRVDGNLYTLPLRQLDALFHFPTGGEVSSLAVNNNEAQGVWTLIASGEYKKGVSKAAKIRNPAIRYAHKLLAHTLFERRENGAVKEDEFAFLIEGIKPFLQTDAFGNTIYGQPRRIHLARVLVNRFLYYQDWVVTNRDTKPNIGFGGLITPILLACGIVLQTVPPNTPILRLDAPTLSVSHFLAGRIRNSYGYRFRAGEADKVVILPNQNLTSLHERNNVLFNPRPFLLHDPNRDGRLASIKKAPTAPPTEEDVEPEIPDTVYGSRRYDFEPYAEAISGEALRTAHTHIGLLQRFTKWQNRQIQKLVKKVKSQGKVIKKQGTMIAKLLKTSSSGGPEEGGSSLPMVLGHDQPEETQPSTQRNKDKAPLSPSSSGSGNYSYDLESSPSHSD